MQTIQQIRSAGHEPRLDIIRHGLSETDALLVEVSLIDTIESLTNKVAGHGTVQGGASLDEYVTR